MADLTIFPVEPAAPRVRRYALARCDGCGSSLVSGIATCKACQKAFHRCPQCGGRRMAEIAVKAHAAGMRGHICPSCGEKCGDAPDLCEILTRIAREVAP